MFRSLIFFLVSFILDILFFSIITYNGSYLNAKAKNSNTLIKAMQEDLLKVTKVSAFKEPDIDLLNLLSVRIDIELVGSNDEVPIDIQEMSYLSSEQLEVLTSFFRNNLTTERLNFIKSKKKEELLSNRDKFTKLFYYSTDLEKLRRYLEVNKLAQLEKVQVAECFKNPEKQTFGCTVELIYK